MEGEPGGDQRCDDQEKADISEAAVHVFKVSDLHLAGLLAFFVLVRWGGVGRRHRGIIAYPKRQRSKQLVGCVLPCFVCGAMWLEQVLQCELELTLSLRVVDQTKGSADGGVRSYQDGVVQDVDCFSAELQALMLDDGEALGDAEVDRLQAGSGEASDLTVAEARGGLGDRARVEPDVAGAACDGRGLLWSLDGLSVAVALGKPEVVPELSVACAVMGKPSWNCRMELTCQPPATRSATRFMFDPNVRPRPKGRS